MRVSCLILTICTTLCTAFVDYEGHKIVRITPNSQKDMEALRNIRSALGFEPDYLRSIRSVGRPGDMVVAPEKEAAAMDFLEKNDIEHTVLVHNFSRVAQRDRRALLSPSNEPITYETLANRYLTFYDQMRLVDQLAATFPQLIRVEIIGYSTEGRPIKALTYGYPSGTPKPILWIEAGIHAREWIAPAAALYTMWKLANDGRYTDLLKRIDIVIVPNSNPDGYEYSRLKDRLWRKTRSRDSPSSCFGVDGNRNYPFHWGQEGVDWKTCSEIYPGQHVLSEPEVRALVNAIESKKDRIRGYLTLHSYGQDILYPWGHKVNSYPVDVNELKAMGEAMARAVRAVSGTDYTVANSAGGLYPASGASDDWAKSIGIKYAYTIELSPRSSYYGFELPSNFIESVSKENMAGMMKLATMIANNQTALGYKKAKRARKAKSNSVKSPFVYRRLKSRRLLHDSDSSGRTKVRSQGRG